MTIFITLSDKAIPEAFAIASGASKKKAYESAKVVIDAKIRHVTLLRICRLRGRLKKLLNFDFIFWRILLYGRRD